MGAPVDWRLECLPVCPVSEAKVARVRCRALKDGTVGWVTIKGREV